MARNAKDPALKALAGNPGKRKPRKPRAPKAGSAKPVLRRWQPTFKLSKAAQIYFDKVARDAKDLGYIRETDMPALTRYAEILGIWQQASEAVRPVEEGGDGKYIDTPMTNGGSMKRLHPAFATLREMGNQLLAIESQFGFTPLARHSILARLASQAPQVAHRDDAAEQAPLGFDAPSPVEFFATQTPLDKLTH